MIGSAITRELLLRALATRGEHDAGMLPLREGMRLAAVVLPVRLGREPTVLMLVRAAALRDHAGEVGFPGGKQETSDVDLRATALREAHEEVHLGPSALEIVGELTPVPVITGRFCIHPFVACVADDAQPKIASTEVARLMEVPLVPWLDGTRRYHAVVTTWRGYPMNIPHFALEGCVLYGASAYLFHELLARIAKALPLELPPPTLTDQVPWGDRYPGVR